MNQVIRVLILFMFIDHIKEVFWIELITIFVRNILNYLIIFDIIVFNPFFSNFDTNMGGKMKIIMEKKVIEYRTVDLTIFWQPDICKHAGVCTRILAKVYNIKEKPWVKPENATTEELIAQIDTCPSGALSYKRDK